LTSEHDVASVSLSLKTLGFAFVTAFLMPSLLPRRLPTHAYPLVLGSGKRFFRDGVDKNVLTLRDNKTTTTGVVVLTCLAAGGDA